MVFLDCNCESVIGLTGVLINAVLNKFLVSTIDSMHTCSAEYSAACMMYIILCIPEILTTVHN